MKNRTKSRREQKEKQEVGPQPATLDHSVASYDANEGLDERVDEGMLRWFGHVRGWIGIGLLRDFTYKGVLVVVQWVGRERNGLIS